MSRSVDTKLRRLGPGVLTTALGIAVEVSDLDGGVVEVLAWSAVAVGAIMILAGSLRLRAVSRCRRRKARPSSQRSLSTELGLLGRDILDYLANRAAQAPTVPPAMSILRHPVKASRERQLQMAAVDAYEADTVSIYEARLGGRVRKVAYLLYEERMIGSNDAGLLTARPETVAEIETIGQRLIAFSQPGMRLRQRAA